MRLLVMGDIHGEYTIMQRVLEKADYKPRQDQLILLGDYVDRGNESCKVVDAVKNLVANGAVALLGNHERMMIDALQNEDYDLWDYNGGESTRNSYKSLEQMNDDAAFLQTLPLYYETSDYIFVHAGALPGVPMKEQDSELLIWARPEEFSNYKGKILVCGHTPVQAILENEMKNTPFQFGDIIFIDTGMGWGQRLTLLQLPEKVYWQSWRWDNKSSCAQTPAKLEYQY
jgi:serine/threonine protein phosphatase 1